MPVALRFAHRDPVLVDTETLVDFVFDGMDLHRVYLESALLRSAKFRGCDIRSGIFKNADASGANFQGAALMNADLTGALLVGAHFGEARPIAANFNNADLTGADLRRADVGLATFRHARLCGSKMHCIRLQEADLTGALFDQHTQWPDGFGPFEKGAIGIT